MIAEMTRAEIDSVSAGDSWAGTPEGRAPYTSPFTQCMIDSVDWSQKRAEIAGTYCGGKILYETYVLDWY